MLVLSRRKNERIVISDESGKVYAIIAVTGVESGKVRIGVNADDDTVIHREEIYERKYGSRPVVGECAAEQRLPHPAVQMVPMDHDDAIHGDAVGRHD